MVVNLRITLAMRRAMNDAMRSLAASEEQIVRWKGYLKKPPKPYTLAPDPAESPLNPRLNEKEGIRVDVSFQVIHEVYTFLKEHEEASYGSVYLHELLEGSSFVVAPAPVVEKSPEELARFKKIKSRVEDKLYSEMIRCISPNSQAMKETWLASESGDRCSNPTKLVLNLVISAVTMGVVLHYAFSRYGKGENFAICAGVIGSFIMLMIEAILFVIYGSRLDSRIGQMHHESPRPFATHQ